MEKTITIKKEDIAEAVYRLTANAEMERGDEAHIATEDNSAVVMGFINDAAHLLSDMVNVYGYAIANDENVVVSLNMPSHWGGKIEVAQDAARVFLENYAIGRWFELSGTADRFNNAASAALVTLKKVLDNRLKPTNN
jgi:hypothetical protein